MRGRTLIVSLVYIASAMAAVSLPGPVASAATRSISVTPSTNLSGGDVVTVSGVGFAPSADIALCEGVISGAPDPEDCDAALRFARSGTNGAFTTQFTVDRFITIVGTQVDCAAPGAACLIGAAEAAGIDGTTAVARISFTPVTNSPRPDLMFKNRATGQLFEGGTYFANSGSAPLHAHAIAPGGSWVYALVIKNNSNVTDDLVLTTPSFPSSPFKVRIFAGYYDVTDYAAGAGVVFHDIAPGRSGVIAVDFSAEPGAQVGSALATVKLSSGSDPSRVDYVRLRVDAPAAATRTVSVSPHTGLSDGDVVTVTGRGFSPSAFVGMCQGIVAGPPGLEDCSGGPIAVSEVDANGGFSNQLTVSRLIVINGAQTVDCAAPGAACMILAAEAGDIDRTAVETPIAFLPHNN
jgi:Neocarzinostatin family